MFLRKVFGPSLRSSRLAPSVATDCKNSGLSSASSFPRSWAPLGPSYRGVCDRIAIVFANGDRYVHVYSHLYTHTHKYIHTYTYIYMYTYRYIHMFMCMYLYAHMYTHVCICIHVLVCIYSCVICIIFVNLLDTHKYIYTPTHGVIFCTHMHTHIFP